MQLLKLSFGSVLDLLGCFSLWNNFSVTCDKSYSP